ncbi:DUF4913 domain-containing protein [Nocardia takedensis]
MTGAAPAGGGTGAGAQAQGPAYPDFVSFAQTWLLPVVGVRLSRGQRENTYTWCARWWDHRPVAVRIAHLHTAFETLRGPGASGFVTGHLDPHLRVILDAAQGPLHRCTPAEHVPTPTLPFEPVPTGWITAPAPAPEAGAEAGAGAADEAGSAQKPPPPPRFRHYALWVQQWLLPVTSVRIAAQQREGTYTWCARWWQHHGVAVRFALLHAAFESAVISPDKTAMSNLFLRQIDPTMRVVLDAAHGPLHRCTPTEHTHLPALTGTRPPRHWFGPAGARTPIERVGFGPDFRAFAGDEGPLP